MLFIRFQLHILFTSGISYVLGTTHVQKLKPIQMLVIPLFVNFEVRDSDVLDS